MFDDYIKKVDACACTEYMNTYDDKIEVCMLEEGVVRAFDKEEFFDAWNILLSADFARYLECVDALHSFNEMYKSRMEYIRCEINANSGNVTNDDIETVTWYASRKTHYKLTAKHLKYELQEMYGNRAWLKVCQLYEGLYRIPMSRIW